MLFVSDGCVLRLVLSTETDHNMEYGSNPYTGYDDPGNTQPRLFKGKVDSRLPAMERVLDVHSNGEYRIYPLSVISRKQVINDTFEDQPLVIFYTLKTGFPLDEKEIAESRRIGSFTVFSPLQNNTKLTFSLDINGYID
jgi:hypothetical protein